MARFLADNLRSGCDLMATFYTLDDYTDLCTCFTQDTTSVEFVTETGGTGHVDTMLAMLNSATEWLDLRLNGTAPAAGCSKVSYFEPGNPLKREEADGANATRTALATP
ncbi:hypothetical protein FIBSPDRAFT_1046742 [Athelia psychrophila]|uniref:Uncharacterized protein n=1 Tax=Athelia psychrophila TaxID=1759441 RepID=A0A166G867_9AGAM|nr:hypothetical protein FIBSPDRAFT_1046742 [Fibularhizoctonia sp. CBS 109695]